MPSAGFFGVVSVAQSRPQKRLFPTCLLWSVNGIAKVKENYEASIKKRRDQHKLKIQTPSAGFSCVVSVKCCTKSASKKAFSHMSALVS